MLGKPISWKVSLPLFSLGFACMAGFRLVGSNVDDNGILHEPFALIPLGWLCLLAGAVIAFASLLRKGLRNR